MRSLFALMLLTAPAFAHPAEGEWLTDGGKSFVQIAACEEQANQFCGTITRTRSHKDQDGDLWVDKKNKEPALRDRPLIGFEILTGFDDKGEGRLRGGTIYNPEDGKTYNSKITVLDDDRIRVEGCVLFFCRSYVWTRVTREDRDRPILEIAPE